MTHATDKLKAAGKQAGAAVTTKQFTAQTFAFLHQVNGNAELAGSDLKIAPALTRAFHKEACRRAYPSYETLANDAAMSEHTAIRAVRRLEQHGHLRVVWGTPGRGHPNQYWMIVKPAPVQVSAPRKPAKE